MKSLPSLAKAGTNPRDKKPVNKRDDSKIFKGSVAEYFRAWPVALEASFFRAEDRKVICLCPINATITPINLPTALANKGDNRWNSTNKRKTQKSTLIPIIWITV